MADRRIKAYKGLGIERDKTAAAGWYKKAAVQGDQIAMDSLKQLGVVKWWFSKLTYGI